MIDKQVSKHFLTCSNIIIRQTAFPWYQTTVRSASKIVIIRWADISTPMNDTLIDKTCMTNRVGINLYVVRIRANSTMWRDRWSGNLDAVQMTTSSFKWQIENAFGDPLLTEQEIYLLVKHLDIDVHCRKNIFTIQGRLCRRQLDCGSL